MNIYDSLMDIFDEKKQGHLCRKTKTSWTEKNIYDETAKYYYITLPFNMVILAHLIRITLPSISIILFQHTFCFFQQKSLLINSTKLID